jgi:hypothetical protein
MVECEQHLFDTLRLNIVRYDMLILLTIRRDKICNGSNVTIDYDITFDTREHCYRRDSTASMKGSFINDDPC